MSIERKRLRLNRETLRHLNDDEMSYVYGGQKANFTLFGLCPQPVPLPQPAPPPQPQPPPVVPSGGSCVGFQCPPGTMQSMNIHCALPPPLVGTITKV